MKSNRVKEDKLAQLHLYEAIASLATKDEVQLFFEDLCTPSERQAMADRWRVVAPILEGVPYRTIHDQTGVSVTTIGRVARFLTNLEGGYRLIVERLKKNPGSSRK